MIYRRAHIIELILFCSIVCSAYVRALTACASKAAAGQDGIASCGTTYKYDSNGTALISIIAHYWPAMSPYALPSKVKMSPLVGFNVTTESRALPLTAILLPRTPTDIMTTNPTIIASKNGYAICTRYGGILTTNPVKRELRCIFYTNARYYLFY